jgi:hypothetical protein
MRRAILEVRCARLEVRSSSTTGGVIPVKPLPQLAILILSAALISSCSLFRESASDPARVMETGAMLVNAGFERVAVENPEQLDTAKGLPQYQLRSYQGAVGPVFWYYDPQFCRCVYVGEERAYERFQDARTHAADVAEYVGDTEDADAASLYWLNGSMMPPPLFLFGGFGGLGFPYASFPVPPPPRHPVGPSHRHPLPPGRRSWRGETAESAPGAHGIGSVPGFPAGGGSLVGGEHGAGGVSESFGGGGGNGGGGGGGFGGGGHGGGGGGRNR